MQSFWFLLTWFTTNPQQPNTYSCFEGFLDESINTMRQDRMVIGVFTGILHIRVEEIDKFVFLSVKYQREYIGFSTHETIILQKSTK